VLDVLETIKSSSTTPKKTVEVSTEAFAAETSKQQFETEAGPSESTKIQPLEVEKMSKESLETEKAKIAEPILTEEIGTATPKHLPKYMIILCDMLRGRNYLKKRFLKPITMPEN
jgi:hypothetical protein